MMIVVVVVIIIISRNNLDEKAKYMHLQGYSIYYNA
jgi:hypothetical protein